MKISNIVFCLFALACGVLSLHGVGSHELMAGLVMAPVFLGYVKTFPITSYQGTLGNLTTGDLMWTIPQGFVFKRLKFTFGGTMAASKIAKLRVRLGSKNIVPDLKGADFVKILAFKGLTADSAYLPIPFFDDTAITEEEARLGEISTVSFNGASQKYSEFTVIVTPDGTQDGTATIALECEIDERAKPSEATHGYDSENMIKAWTYADAPLTAANANNVLPFNNGTDYRNSILALYLFNSNVTKFSLTRDQEKILDNILVGSLGFSQKQGKRVPQSGMMALDFCPNGQILGNAFSLQRINPDGTSGGQYAMKWEAYATGTETARQVVEILAPYAQV